MVCFSHFPMISPLFCILYSAHPFLMPHSHPHWSEKSAQSLLKTTPTFGRRLELHPPERFLLASLTFNHHSVRRQLLVCRQTSANYRPIRYLYLWQLSPLSDETVDVPYLRTQIFLVFLPGVHTIMNKCVPFSKFNFQPTATSTMFHIPLTYDDVLAFERQRMIQQQLEEKRKGFRRSMSTF